MYPPVLIITGTTASGKTVLADRLNERFHIEIINADSIQIYNALHILSAQPVDRKNTYLYSYIQPNQKINVAKFLEIVKPIIHEITQRGKIPVIVGGSTLYIDVLLNGIANIPNITETTRQYIESKFQYMSKQDFFNELKTIDMNLPEHITHNDSYRMKRAYEVIYQTNISINQWWQAKNITILDNCAVYMVSILPHKENIITSVKKRIYDMLDLGAIKEVEEFNNQFGSHHHMHNIIGLSEIIEYIYEDCDIDSMVDKLHQRTMLYVKRQNTWFKNRYNNPQFNRYHNNICLDINTAENICSSILCKYNH